MAHIFDVGTRAWQPDEKEGWVASEVEEKLVEGDKVTLVFRLENGEVRPSTLARRIRPCRRRGTGTRLNADRLLHRPKPW